MTQTQAACFLAAAKAGAYIACKYFLTDEECREDDLIALGNRSTAKTAPR